MPRTSSPTVRRPASVIALTAALALVSACAKTSPTEPDRSRTYTLSGHVRLVGYLVNFDGTFAGTRHVDDADGVPVELRYGPSVLARTHTVDGVYRFPGLRPGSYRVRATAFGSIWDETTDLQIHDGDLFSGDPLDLRSRGDIHPAPNPFTGLVVMSFAVPDSQFVSLKIRDMQGDVVQSLYGQWLPKGLYMTAWNGYDSHSQPATAPCYWATFESGADIRAQLLFH